jgi:hypothetical protein
MIRPASRKTGCSHAHKKKGANSRVAQSGRSSNVHVKDLPLGEIRKSKSEARFLYEGDGACTICPLTVPVITGFGKLARCNPCLRVALLVKESQDTAGFGNFDLGLGEVAGVVSKLTTSAAITI